MIANAILADVAELADALDLGSSTARCEGSSPFIRISENTRKTDQVFRSALNLHRVVIRTYAP
jgi:hypothetical protein